jgi:putative ribosome biogenesis GTPase RsgA
LNLAGTVVAAYGRQYRVELAAGVMLLCVPRGKKSELVCGDRVMVQRTSADQGVIGALETAADPALPLGQFQAEADRRQRHAGDRRRRH